MTQRNRNAKAKVANKLMDAADLLGVHGWCRGESHDDRGRYCISGAMAAVCVGTGSEGNKAHEQGLNAADTVLSNRSTDAISWNDDTCRSGKQAQALLREAASLALDGT